MDGDGHVSQDRALLQIDNLLIAAPQNNDILRKGGAIEVRGSILASTGFQSYVVEYGVGHDPIEWLTSGITLPNGGTTPVIDGLLATWDTSAIGAESTFTLRLMVTGTWGQSQEFVRSVYLDPTLKPGWPQRSRVGLDDSAAFGLQTAAKLYSFVPRSGTGASSSAASLPTMSTGDPAFSALAGVYFWGGYLEPVVHDLDGDGHQEVVVYRGGVPPDVLVYRDDGTLAWTAPAGTSGVAGGNVHIPLVADVDGDGLAEVFVYAPDFAQQVGTLYGFAHDGATLPGWPIAMPMDYHPALLAADLDGDGLNEIVVKGNGGTPRMMVVVRGNGQIVSQWVLPVKNWGATLESSPAVGDLDGDGRLEIVIGDPSELAGYDFNTGEWNNTGVVHVYEMDGSELPGWPQYTDGIIFSSPAIGDLDGDGRNEIVVGLMFEGSVPDYHFGGLYAFDGTGHVLPGWPVEKGWNFWSSPSLGDLDGDGDLEIASSELGFLTFLVHHDGTVAAGWPQATAWNDYYSTIIADVDGDGAPDLLTSAGGGVYAWSYAGATIAGFPKPTESDAQGPATVADLDQDGQAELVASSDFDFDQETGNQKFRGSLYVWDLSASYAASTMEWPHVHHDARHTGLYEHLCGDGTRDADEQCDDGNLTSGDGCSPSCELELCGPVPATGCRGTTTRSSSLSIKNPAADKNDRFQLKWTKGEATSLAEFGDPLHSTGYVVCVYDSSASAQPLLTATAPAGGTCKKAKPCWKASKGRYSYDDGLLTPDGLQLVRLKEGVANKARIEVKGKGSGLRPPSLPLTLPVTVQIKNTTTGVCWDVRLQ